MAKILGYKRADFTTEDKKKICGCNLYVGYEVNPNIGGGFEVERIYITDAKLENSGLTAGDVLNKEVKIYYNRRGKVDSLEVIG